jgi:hypothetical protein
MRILFLLYLMTLASLCSLSQVFETNISEYQSRNWAFGFGNLLKFQDDTVFPENIKINSYENSSSFSINEDSVLYWYSGDTFRYSNGQIRYDLNGSFSATQGSVFLKHPNNANVFLFSQDENSPSYSNKLYLNVIGLNKFEEVNKIKLLRSTEKLAAVNHQNQKDIIITSHIANSNTFVSLLLKHNGVVCCPILQNIGFDYSLLAKPFLADGGQFKYSPNGEYFCSSTFSKGITELYRMDLESMIFKDTFTVIQLPYIWGVEFSRNSEVLYLGFNRIFQYDISNYDQASIHESKMELTTNLNNAIGSFQITPNNTILIAMNDSSFLGEIKNPNELGMSSNYVYNSVNLGSNKSGRGLPNFNSSYFYTPSIDFAYTEDCWGHSYAFEGRDTFDADGYKWLFRDVRNETLDTRQGKNVRYTFPQADSLENKYEVSHIAYNANRADTVTKTLTIRPKWKNDVLGRDTFYCTGDSIKLILQAPQDMHCVHWNEEEPNLDEALGPIVDYDHFHTDSLLVDTAGTYIVKVTNKTFCQMWDTIRVTEKPNPQQPNIQRISQELESTIAAAEYRWYYEGRPKFQNEISKIQPDSNGYWQVQLVSEFGCESELSDSLYVGYASIPSIKATNAALSFNVYPNPSDGNISIKVPKQGEYNIQITDLNGTVVYTTKHNLNLSFEFVFVFAKGTYIVTLTDEEGNTGSKQIVVR